MYLLAKLDLLFMNFIAVFRLLLLKLHDDLGFQFLNLAKDLSQSIVLHGLAWAKDFTGQRSVAQIAVFGFLAFSTA
jgi:hypothetical protein